MQCALQPNRAQNRSTILYMAHGSPLPLLLLPSSHIQCYSFPFPRDISFLPFILNNIRSPTILLTLTQQFIQARTCNSPGVHTHHHHQSCLTLPPIILIKDSMDSSMADGQLVHLVWPGPCRTLSLTQRRHAASSIADSIGWNHGIHDGILYYSRYTRLVGSSIYWLDQYMTTKTIVLQSLRISRYYSPHGIQSKVYSGSLRFRQHRI